MCNCDCNCNDGYNANYFHCSNGVQEYAKPSAGPYIASEHIPGEYGPTYVA